MPPIRKPLDLDRYNALRSQGFSTRRIAKEMGIPESTLRENLSPKTRVRNNESIPEVSQEIPSSSLPKVDIGIPLQSTLIPAQSIPEVHLEIPFQELGELLPTIRKMVKWWQAREDIAAQKPEKLERFTFHMEPRFMELIKREADLSGETYATVVNRAFSKYFSGS